MSADPASRPGSRHQQAITVAVIVVLLFAVAAVLMFGPRSRPSQPIDYRSPSSSASLDTSPAVPVPFVSAPQLNRLPAATTDTTINRAPHDGRAGAGTSGAVVHNRQQIPVFDAPGGTAFARLLPKQLGADTWLPMIAQQNGWMQVLLPSRPNGSTGWLGTNQLTIARSSNEIHIDLDAGRLQLMTGGRPVGTWTVSTGTSKTPTPAGRTFLLAVIRDPQQPFSPLILTLGTHSTALDSYAGGPGTVGIHTWPTADGPRASHGCIRVPKPALTALEHVPLGSLVRIDHPQKTPSVRKEHR